MPHLRPGLGFRVTVENLSTGRKVVAVTTEDEAGYRFTIVDIETARAARIGDNLEISAQSPDSLIGVESLRYTVTTADVKRSWIQLPTKYPQRRHCCGIIPVPLTRSHGYRIGWLRMLL